jgi:hypothetical protein
MSRIDPKIIETLKAYGEPTEGSIWFVQGHAVIYHKAVERIGARANILFEEPTIIRAERDEAVILVRGKVGERWDYDIGEALLNVNYRISGKQAGYVYAMALKRGRDRLILKLIGLHGLLYSETEADEFRAGRPPSTEAPAEPSPSAAAVNNEIMHRAIETGETSDHGDGVVTPDASLSRLLEDIRFKIDSYKQADTVERLMVSDDTKAVLSKLGEEDYQEIRSYAWLRIRALREAAKYTSAKVGA